MDDFPPFSEDLVKNLDKVFGGITPQDVRTLSKRELAFKAGQRSLVELLLTALARTKEEAI